MAGWLSSPVIWAFQTAQNSFLSSSSLLFLPKYLLCLKRASAVASCLAFFPSNVLSSLHHRPCPPPPSLHAAFRVIFSPSVHLWHTGAEILNVFFFVAGWSPDSSVFDYKAFHDLTPVTFPTFPLTASAPLP